MNQGWLVRALALAVCASALIASAAIGASRKQEPQCKASWFVPTLRYEPRGKSIEIRAAYTYLARAGAVCHISAARAYFGELWVLGRGSYDLVPPAAFSFSGDQPAGGGGGTGVTIPLRIWCRKQPIELKLLGPSPNDPLSKQAYNLVLRGIKIDC